MKLAVAIHSPNQPLPFHCHPTQKNIYKKNAVKASENHEEDNRGVLNYD